MNVRQYARGIKRRLKGEPNLSRLDTIANIRRRNADFDAVRDRIRASGTDSLAHFANGYTHEGDLLLQQNPDEFAALTLFLRERRPHKSYMEIGSASGGACLFLFREVGFESVVSLDDGEHPRAPAQAQHFAELPNFTQFLGDSHSPEARAFLQRTVKGKFDVAFIDGDHSWEGVWQDVELTLPFCRKGALVIFHDTLACDGVKKAWHRLIKEKRITPLAEYLGEDRPLGIGIGEIN